MSLGCDIHTLYGVLGYPLTHSWSADYFNDKFRAGGIVAVFKEFDCGSLDDFMAMQLNKVDSVGIGTGELLSGFTVTMPYKQDIIGYLDSVDEVAMAIGAVNCVRVERRDEGVVMRGYNTDVVGFMQSFRPDNVKKKVMVFGTGGASKAVCYGLKELSFEVAQVSRSEGYYGYGDVKELLMEGYVNLVNCTPVGMYPDVDGCLSLPWELIDSECYLYDLVYNPSKTRFLEMGEARGATIENGLSMLHIQADEAWRIWNYE